MMKLVRRPNIIELDELVRRRAGKHTHLEAAAHTRERVSTVLIPIVRDIRRQAYKNYGNII